MSFLHLKKIIFDLIGGRRINQSAVNLRPSKLEQLDLPLASRLRQPQRLLVARRLSNAHQRPLDGWHENPQARHLQDHSGPAIPTGALRHPIQVGQRTPVHAADPGGARAGAGEPQRGPARLPEDARLSGEHWTNKCTQWVECAQ